MGSHPSAAVIRGDAGRFIFRVAVYIVIVGAALSVMLVGSAWGYFLAASLAAFVPVLSACYLALRRWDWFSLDDASQTIRFPFRKPLPYDRVAAIDATVSDGLVRLSIRTGKFGGPVLLLGAEAARRGDILSELSARFPAAEVRQRAFPAWAALGGFLFTVALLQATLIFYLRQAHPAAAAPCEIAEWFPGSAEVVYLDPLRLGNVSFAPPRGYLLVQQQPDGMRYLFRRADGALLVVRPGLLQTVRAGGGGPGSQGESSAELAAAAKWLRLLGVAGSYDLLELAYRARWSAIPVILKVLVTSGNSGPGPFDVSFYSVDADGWRGLVRISEGADNGTADILLTGRDKKEEISFYLRTDGAVSTSAVAAILGGVEFSRP